MKNAFIAHLSAELVGLKSAGLYKSERVITSPQSSEIELADGGKVLNPHIILDVPTQTD